jgi:hypothetical protein
MDLITKFCTECHTTPDVAKRFLTARHYDYIHAQIMHSAMVLWRDKNRDKFAETYTFSEVTTENEHTILSIRLLDVVVLDPELVLWDIVCALEAALKLSDTIILRIDATHVGLTNFNRAAAEHIIKTMSDYYPERTSRIEITGLWRPYRWVWGLVSMVLDERTRAKVLVL